MNQDLNIELRSEKVRNIIGQIPPSITRIGIAVMFALFLVILSVAYLYRFDDAIEASARIYPDEKGDTYYIVKVPFNFFDKVRVGQKITFQVKNTHHLISTVQSIYSTSHVKSDSSYFVIKGNVILSGLIVEEAVWVDATIFIKKVNVFEYFLNK